MMHGGGYYGAGGYQANAHMASPAQGGGPTANSSIQSGANWKSQIIGQIQQRNQKEVKAYAEIFGACQSHAHAHRTRR